MRTLVGTEPPHHPHILALVGAYCPSDNERLYLVSEFCAGGSLLHLCRKRIVFHEHVVSVVFYQLLCALSFMHGLSLLHRDLKSDNILLESTSGCIKVCDHSQYVFPRPPWFLLPQQCVRRLTMTRKYILLKIPWS